MVAGRLSLYFNMRSDKGSILTAEEYITYSATYGPTFADVLKKAKSLATLSTLSKIRFIDLEEKIDEFNEEWGKLIHIDKERKYSYDDFLNEDNLFFFNDETVDDLQWAYEPLEIDENALEEFRGVLREVLTTWKVADLQQPSRHSTSSWTSDSTCFDENPKDRTIHRNIVRDRLRAGSSHPFGRLTDEFRFRRSIIPVAPGNFRDSWEPNFDTLFTIRSISHVMRQVVQPIPYSTMYDSTIAYRRKKKILEKEDSLYLMLDYKKSAITIPRRILTVMGEELYRVYPIKEMEAILSYENLQLYDKKWTVPLRGVGLGNMNELYTLMQCVFGHLSKKAYGTGSVFFNDDAVYELTPVSYRRQTVGIMSFIRRLGLILNLSKSLISESNIFCEEYRTLHGVDYRKIQLLVVPMIGAMFCPTTATAKRHIYSIERGLVGTGLRYLALEFVNLLTQIYKNEFGKMDQYLPYHLGGWIDFSDTNFSCIAEYCLDPWCYLTTPKELGQIPEIRRWIAYNLDPLNNKESILSSKARIAYRGQSLINSEKGHEIYRYDNPLSEYIYRYLGLQTPSETEASLDDVVNYRGLHNAKPRIKSGLAYKNESTRSRFFIQYKRFGQDRLNLITRDGPGLRRVIENIKSMEDSPSYLCFPRIFLKESQAVENGYKNKIIVYKKAEGTSKSLQDMKGSIASTIESILTRRWIYRADPFIFHDFWRRKKSGYLLSERGIPNIIAKNFNLPIDFRAFCPNASLFVREFAVRTNRLPISWKPSTDLSMKYQMYMFKDAFELILPTDLIGRWRDIKDLYKKDFYILRNILSNMNLCSRKEFKAFLDSAEELFYSDLSEFYTQPDTVDEDILELLERFEEDNLYTHIISEVYTVEDLLDDEDIFNLSLDDEDQEENFELEDFETYSDSDSEYGDSNPGFNEIRRLARESQHSALGDQM